MPTRSVGDLNMYYELSGGGKPVVFISGITLDHLPWKIFQVPAFSAAGYQCLVFDNRDVGQTGDSPVGGYEITRFARDTIELTEQLGLRSFHLIGYSMGGLIAQEIALAIPERVRTLTLLATFAKPDAQLIMNVATLRIAKRKLSREEFLQVLGLRVFTHRFYENADAVDAWMTRALANPFPQSVEAFGRQADAVLNHDSLERLYRISSPTHIVVGEEDILIPPRHSRVLAERIPNARLALIPEAGHAVASERSAEFNRVALEFLARH